jgi:PTS system nitrogen regulatory IIA component
MPLSQVLSAESIVPSLKASSKKQALQLLSEKAAKLTGMTEREIFQTLVDREKLGSTGVGGGVAIPHGKLKQIDQIYGFFARLARPVDFEAIDDQPVDLIFLLLAPEDAGADHLKTLARVARALREPELVDRLRETSDARTLLEILTGEPKTDAA